VFGGSHFLEGTIEAGPFDRFKGTSVDQLLKKSKSKFQPLDRGIKTSK